MPASLAQVTSNHARMESEMPDGSTFFIEYRPAQITPRQLHALAAMEERPFDMLRTKEQADVLDATTRLLADCLIATDLTTSAGEPFPTTLEGLQDVSYVDQAAMLNLIREDQRVGEANGSGSSPASSTPPKASLPTKTLVDASPLSLSSTTFGTSPNGSMSPS
jgi:hypothetical protein